MSSVPSAEIPDAVRVLLWDVDPKDVDLERHADFVIERVMSRGTWAAMKWLRATYAKGRLADFLRRRSDRLAPRDRAYWALVTDVELDVPVGGGRPPWAGP